jgi:hypothetical protein
MRKLLLLSLFIGLFSSCSLWERKQFKYSYEELNENEIQVDFTKINPGSWDTLLFVPPYATSEQIGVGYMDGEFLAQRALDDSKVLGAFLHDGKLMGYTACVRQPVDFIRLFDDLDSVFVLKIPRSEALFRYVKQEVGTYSLVK